MRWWVWLLLLVNVAIFGYFYSGAGLPQKEAINKPIDPEKLKILSAKELALMPKKTPPAASVADVAAASPASPTSCYKWGDFTSTNLPSAQVVLAKLNLEGVVSQEPVVQQDRRFWVYYPPLKNAQLAREKAEEIKTIGVDELYIVQDSQWRNAISFGLFSDEKLASNLLAELKEKGIKGATKALRNPGNNLSSLLIKGVTAEVALELDKIKPEFVGSELTPTACP